MQQDDMDNKQSNPSSQDETQYSDKFVREVFQNEHGHSIAPLAVGIDCQNLTDWTSEYNQKFSSKMLSKEIESWSSLVGFRQITRLTVKNPSALWDEASLANVLEDIRQQLRFTTGPRLEMAMEIDACLADNHLFLEYKKLGINHVYLHCPQDLPINDFDRLKAHINSHGIAHVSVAYPIKQPFRRSSPTILQILSQAKPEVLKLTNEYEETPDIAQDIIDSGLISTLFEFGYKQHTLTSFVKIGSKFQSKTNDILNLGPRAISTFGKLEFINLSSPSTYLHAINNQRLPIAYFRPSKATRAANHA